MKFFEGGFFGGKNEKREEEDKQKLEAEKAELQEMVSQREKFLASQRGAEKEGTKRFENLRNFKEDPAGHLRDLYTKDLESEVLALEQKLEEMKFAKAEFEEGDIEMHQRNIEMLQRKISLIDNYGEEAIMEVEKEESLDSIDTPKEERGWLRKLEAFSVKGFLNSQYEKMRSMKEGFEKRVYPNLRYYALALMTLGTPNFANNGQENNSFDGDKDNIENTLSASRLTNETATDNFEIDIYNRFETVDSQTGETKFNPWGIVAPVSVEWGYATERIKEDKIDVPYEYARLFDSAEELNEGDKGKVYEYVDGELKKTLAHKLMLLDTKGTYKAFKERSGGLDLTEVDQEKVKIKSISITGMSSPEAFSEAGASSVSIGSVEEKNLELAEKRAKDMEAVLRDVLAGNNLSPELISQVNFEEVQFSDSEWATMLEIAEEKGIENLSEEEIVYELVRMYNQGDFESDAEVKAKMDEIVGSKRNVEIVIEYEDNETEDKTVIALPLLLLLLPLLRKARFGKKLKKQKTDVEYEETYAVEVEEYEETIEERTEIVEETIEQEEKIEKEIPAGRRQIFSEREQDKEDLEASDINYYELYSVADEGISPKDKLIIENRLIADEVRQYINNYAAKHYGLDYFGLIEDFAEKRKEQTKNGRPLYSTDEEFETDIAKDLLRMWEDYDRNVREEIGINTPEEALDYRHDRKKVLWAKIASPVFRELIDIYNDQEPTTVYSKKLAVNIRLHELSEEINKNPQNI